MELVIDYILRRPCNIGHLIWATSYLLCIFGMAVRDVIPFSEFFGSPVILKVQALTLRGLRDFDFIMDISFAHLEYLAINLPRNYFEQTKPPLDLPLIPTLQRLYIDFQV